MTFKRTQYLECDVQDCFHIHQGGENDSADDLRKAAAEQGWTSHHSTTNAMADIDRQDICPVDHDA